jgi:GNAT superfamily N-acetyltransferase
MQRLGEGDNEGDDQVLVGTATGMRAGDGDTLVVGMYVAPEARGQGCAQLLLDAIADLASQRQDRRFSARSK